MSKLKLFAPNVSRFFVDKIASVLNISPAEHEEREFEDGEHKIRPLESVRGDDVFVVQSLFSDSSQSVNDKLCRLLFFIGALRDASAKTVTAAIPYLAYARKDRKSQPRDPVTSRYVAQLLEAVGTYRVLAMDVHNVSAFQNAFRCRTDHLEATPLFIEALLPRLKDQEVLVLSPDPGGVKRAEKLREGLEMTLGREVGLAFMEKARAKGILRTGRLVGEIGKSNVVIVDDLISTGSTLVHAAKVAKEAGAAVVYACATHGVFAAKASQVLSDPALDKILITDTIPCSRLNQDLVAEKVEILPASILFAEAIRNLHSGGSIVELLIPKKS